MQRRIPGSVRGVQRTAVREQQTHHRHGPDGCSAVECKLASLVLNPGGRLGGDQGFGDVQVVFRGAEV